MNPFNIRSCRALRLPAGRALRVNFNLWLKTRHPSAVRALWASRLRHIMPKFILSLSKGSRRTVFFLLIALLAAPLAAKDRLGVYQGWAAFRDPATPRCYAISAPEETVGTPTRNGYLSIGFWPKRRVTHQIYVRLSRERSSNSGITLSAGGRRFRLKVDGNSGWATDRRMDLAIIAAMRSATSLSVESIGRNGRSIVDAYSLRGAASAIDAAALGCVKL
jgi:hypothetical protein